MSTCVTTKFRDCRLMPALAFAASLAMTIGAAAQGRAEPLARECAQKDLTVFTLIEEHGAADDLPAERLGNAALALQRARSACYEGRVGEALALYEGILDLGPVASLREQRP